VGIRGRLRLRSAIVVAVCLTTAAVTGAFAAALLALLRRALAERLPEEAVASAMDPARTTFVSLWIVGMAITAAAAVLVGRGLGAPLERLAVSARRWAHGEFSHRADVSGPPEVASLAAALNQMAGSLWYRDDELHLHAKDRIMESEKLATIGRLAAGIAHEINNPIGGILLYSNLLLESTPESDPRRENMAKIVAQAERARTIVRGLLDFSRQTPSAVDRVDLNRIVSGVLALLERHPAAQNIEVRAELSAEPLWVRADVSRLEQVFINIVVNALEAMDGSGSLTVRSGLSERSGFCRVAITDTGPGIAEENKSRLFEPFFTTKEVGRGIGLGLAISYGIVQQHHGDIAVQSAPGAGATFRVLLPVWRAGMKGPK